MGITGQFNFTGCTLCPVNAPNENNFSAAKIFSSPAQCALFEIKGHRSERARHVARKKPPVEPVQKAPRKLWSLQPMEAALRDVEDGSRDLREAARAPVETIRRRALGQVRLECRSGPPYARRRTGSGGVLRENVRDGVWAGEGGRNEDGLSNC